MTGWEPVLVALAGNPSALHELLLALARTGIERVQREVGSGRYRRRLAPELLDVLADSPHRGVRMELARRIDAPDDLLVRLARDPDVIVRRCVAFRYENIWQPVERYLPDEAYAALVEDDDEVVQERLLGNPEVPDHIVMRLTRHAELRDLVLWRRGSPEEAEQAYRRLLTAAPLATIRDVLLNWDGYSASYIVQNPRVPDELIDELSRSPNVRHRWRAFLSGRLTEEQRQRLAQGPDPELAAEAGPPPSPADLIAWLSGPSIDLQCKAAKHPELPVEVMWEVAARAGVRPSTG